MKKTEYKLMKLSDITPSEENPRTIDPEDREVLRKKLEKYGNVGVLVVNKDGLLLSGHQRLSLLKEMGETEAMVVIGDYTEAEAYELMIDINSSLGSGKWDRTKLDELTIKLRNLDDFDEQSYSETKLDKLEELELSQYRDLQGFSENYLGSADDGEDGGESKPARQEDGVLYSYNIVFRDAAELNTWLSYIHELRMKYPDLDTVSQRVLTDLTGDERGEA